MAEERNLTNNEQIQTRAYYLWEADGRPHGRDWEYWMKAQQELSRENESAPVAASASVAPQATAGKKTLATASKPAATTSKRRTSARSAVLA